MGPPHSTMQGCFSVLSPCRLQTEQEALALAHEQPMAPRIQMSRVVGSLEEQFAELGIPNIDARLLGGVEDGNGVSATHFDHDADDLVEARTWNAPGCDKGQLGRGIFGNETTAETVQSCLELLQGALSARDIVGVVVAANDQYVVCRVVHLLIEIQEGLAPFLGLAVEHQASAITPIVAVGHVVFLGNEIVPCLRKGTFVFFHIAVANDVLERMP